MFTGPLPPRGAEILKTHKEPWMDALEVRMDFPRGGLVTDTLSIAIFSKCGLYRYWLSRSWAVDPKMVNFLMLNPSTADELKNDPTVARCEKRARQWGFGGYIVTNLFAYRATDPGDMKRATDPVGPVNDIFLKDAAITSVYTVCAWGEHGRFQSRSSTVRELLRGHSLRYLKMNGSGEPAHPLYLPYHLVPQVWI